MRFTRKRSADEKALQTALTPLQHASRGQLGAPQKWQLAGVLHTLAKTGMILHGPHICTPSRRRHRSA